MENHKITKRNNHQAENPSMFVFCTNCYKFYFDKLHDSEIDDNATLHLLFDEENQEYFSGCPECQTDGYLLNVEDVPSSMYAIL